jgi:hypothetical protein
MDSQIKRFVGDSAVDGRVGIPCNGRQAYSEARLEPTENRRLARVAKFLASKMAYWRVCGPRRSCKAATRQSLPDGSGKDCATTEPSAVDAAVTAACPCSWSRCDTRVAVGAYGGTVRRQIARMLSIVEAKGRTARTTSLIRRRPFDRSRWYSARR